MRKWIIGLFALVAIWSGLWLYASREAGHQVDAWIATEAGQGRIWTCPNRTIGGYPLALTIGCSDPTFAGRALGQSVEASLASLVAELSILHPGGVSIGLRPPFTYKTSDGQADVTGTWSGLRVDLTGLSAIRTVSLTGTDVAVKGQFAQAGQQGGTAAALATRIDLPGAEADPTLGFDVAIDGLPIPALDAQIGAGDPYAVHLVGSLDRAAIGDARTPEDAMERWRRAGGRVDLTSARLTRGGSKVMASGTMALDDAHRPQGRLAAQFVGLAPILKRFGISGDLAAAGSLLSSLFGGGAPKAAPTEPGALALPISVQNGRLAVGPIRTAVTVPPLY